MPPRERLGPLLLLALLAVALVAGALVYRARTPNLALEVPRIERELTLGAPGEEGIARVRFFVRFDEPDATVQIVGDGRVPRRTLATGYEFEAEREVACVWDGRDDDGELVERGEYRLRVVLPGQERDMVYPRRISAARDRSADAPDREREAPTPAALPCEEAG